MLYCVDLSQGSEYASGSKYAIIYHGYEDFWMFGYAWLYLNILQYAWLC